MACSINEYELGLGNEFLNLVSFPVRNGRVGCALGKLTTLAQIKNQNIGIYMDDHEPLLACLAK
jgi:hypothetical protein